MFPPGDGYLACSLTSSRPLLRSHCLIEAFPDLSQTPSLSVSTPLTCFLFLPSPYLSLTYNVSIYTQVSSLVWKVHEARPLFCFLLHPQDLGACV